MTGAGDGGDGLGGEHGVREAGRPAVVRDAVTAQNDRAVQRAPVGRKGDAIHRGQRLVVTDGDTRTADLAAQCSPHDL